MSPAAEQLFSQAVNMSPVQRAEILSSACEGNLALRQTVENLLAENDRRNSPSVTPLLDLGSTVPPAEFLPAGSRIGRYTILKPLGMGGMGVVYRARDEKLEREVAIKMLSPGVLLNPEARRHFLSARVAEGDRASADDHGELVRLELEVLLQSARRRIFMDVQIDVRVRVAGKELLKSQRVGGMTRSEQDDVPDLRLDEPDAPQYIGAQEDLTELRVRLNDGPQSALIDLERLSILADAHPHHAADSAQGAHFAAEPTGRVGYHDRLPGHSHLHDLDAARQHHPHRQPAIAGFRQDLPRPNRAALPVALQPCQLRAGQYGEHLTPARCQAAALGEYVGCYLISHIRAANTMLAIGHHITLSRLRLY